MAREKEKGLVFSVYYPQRDMIALFHGPLYEGRKRAYEKRWSMRRKKKTLISGMESRYFLKINRRTLRWELTAGEKLLQKSYPQNGGYYVITKSYNGNIISKTTYQKKHRWVRTAYFEQGNTAKPVAVFAPMENGRTVEYMEFQRDQHMYKKTVLYPCPVNLGTAENSYLDSVIGAPEFYLATSEGDLGYYRDEAKASARAEFLDKLSAGETIADPVWIKEDILSAFYVEEEEKLDIGEDYRYQGETDENGERHGRGRTEKKNGMTAYEGDYIHGKRSGKGVYYYDDGSFCYYGGWKNNKRSGMGITVKKDAQSVHIGNWDAGILSGVSAVFGEDGALKNFGLVNNGEMQGVKVHFTTDKKILVGNWDGNSLTGFGCVFNDEGKLLYCGGLENGKRSGEGASFKGDGSIDCVGQWKNDTCPIHFNSGN